MCAMVANKKFRIFEAPKARQTKPDYAMLFSISTCAVIVAFAALWFEFFRNLATLPRALMLWHFHF
jgi:hypothetical protein